MRFFIHSAALKRSLKPSLSWVQQTKRSPVSFDIKLIVDILQFQCLYHLTVKNLSLQGDLYQLRADTKAAFDEAQSLLARQKDLDREQKELYQVRTVRPPSLFTVTRK
jgi:hypothetical protein